MSQSCNDGWQMYKKAGGFKGLARRLTYFPANTSAPMKQICERPPVSVIDLSGIGYGFRGNNGSVRTYLSFLFQMKKKEREICETAIFAKIARLQGATFGIQFKSLAAGDFSPVSPLHAFLDISVLVWNCGGFSRELRECMNVFAVSIPNE